MVDKIKGRPSQKTLLLDCAISLVGTSGTTALTIGGLAESAGVTKGGVQYHFASKDQLLRELLAYVLDGFEQEVNATAGHGADGKAWLRAYVSVSLGTVHLADGVAAALLSAMAPGDPVGEIYQTYARRWRDRAGRDVADRELAHVIRHAADALWLERSFGALNMSEIAALRIRLLALVDSLR